MTTSVSSLRTTVTDLGPWPVRSCSNALAASAICCAMVESACSIGSSLVFGIIRRQRNKKAGVVEHLAVFDHAGLLVNEPPGKAGMPFT